MIYPLRRFGHLCHKTGMEKHPTIAELTRQAERELAEAGVENPAVDARIFAAKAVGRDRAWLAAHGDHVPSSEEIAAMKEMLRRRGIGREPVARILGQREFWGLPFALNAATLEPRPDSETLISATLSLKGGNGGKSAARHVLDLGTGSGCLLLALLSEWPNARGVGVDISPIAVKQAQENATRLGLDERAEFKTGDWLAATDGKFDVVISNPPYIPSGDISGLMPEVRDHDPRAALDGGDDGLDAYRRIIPLLPSLMAANGLAVLEVGEGQADAVAEMLKRAGSRETAAHRDYGGIFRCVTGKFP